jgi:hypothetical protein
MPRVSTQASRLLAESLDYEQTLNTVARLAVPDVASFRRMADACGSRAGQGLAA